jgi:hypothetical protein
MPLRFAILHGSVREARQSIRAARFVEDRLRRGHATSLVNAKECDLPRLDRMYKGMGQPIRGPAAEAGTPVHACAHRLRAAGPEATIGGRRS